VGERQEIVVDDAARSHLSRTPESGDPLPRQPVVDADVAESMTSASSGTVSDVVRHPVAVGSRSPAETRADGRDAGEIDDVQRGDGALVDGVRNASTRVSHGVREDEPAIAVGRARSADTRSRSGTSMR